MRDIKFRGKTVVNEWTYGWIKSWKHFNGTFFERVYSICDEENEQLVIPETIGQFTGLKYKNGKDIYSGDIFSLNGINMFVEYIDDRCCYILTTGLGYDTRNCKDLNCDTIFGLEIISNIHDSPELLK